MKSDRIKISLDSSVFKDLDFIEFLQVRSDQFEIYLSVITFLETYHWYNIRGISKDEFEKEMDALAIVMLI